MSKKKTIVLIITAAVIIALIITASLIISRGMEYAKEKRAEAREGIQKCREVSREEAAWISDNILKEGAVLLYEKDKNGEGHVNPYFACQAMLGLVSDPEGTYLDKVCDYLNWHTKKLLEEEGIISDYDYKNGLLESKKEADSVDSYAAEYLLLLSKYNKAGGKLEDIKDYEIAMVKLAGVYEDLISNGITYTDNKLKRAYLMDNAECYEAVTAASDIAGKDKNRYLTIGANISTSVHKLFWDDSRKCYNTAIDKDKKVLIGADFNEFYPDCIAQVYPSICGMNEIGENERRLYDEICSHHSWENSHIKDTSFEWSVAAYAAVVFGDSKRFDSYLEYYRGLTAQSRKYPMHTANAGWIMRACNLRIEELSKELDKSDMDYIVEYVFSGDHR